MENNKQNIPHPKDETISQNEQVNSSMLSSDVKFLNLQEEIDILKLELKLQKDEFHLANEKAGMDATIYSNLYDFAPLGYFKINAEGIIKETNQYGSAKLFNKKSDLIDSNFKDYIAPNCRVFFNDFFQKLVTSNTNQNCEVRLRIDDTHSKFVHIEGVYAQNEEKYLFYVTDISKRKLIEEDLQLAENENRSILNAFQHIVFRINTDGVILSYRAPNEELLFTKPENFINKNAADVLPENIAALFDHSAKNAIQENKVVLIEYSLSLSTGEHYFEAHIIPVNSKEVLVFINEITTRKRDELELIHAKEIAQENEIRFKALHNASFGGIGIHDKGTILECNQGLSDMTGYSIDELIGMDGLQLIAERSRNQVMRYIQSGYEKPYEEFGLRKNGKEFPMRIEARNIPYKGKTVRTVEFRDISNQKKAELEILKAKDEAQKNEIFYNTILNNMGDPVFVKDNNSRLLLVNDAFCELYNLSRKDIIGKTLAEEVAPEEQEVFLKIDSQVLYDGVENINEETLTIRDGEMKTISTRKTRFLDSDGTKYLIGIIRDITSRKKIEEDLFAAKEKAEESDRLKSSFLANMSHEIRTPMNGILGFASLLKEPNLSGIKQQEYINIIEESGERMLNIINDIISISKIEAGLMEMHKQQSNINEQVEYIYNFFLPEVESKGIKLFVHNSLTFEDATITTDREKVFAILTNLVKNAIKHTENGTIDFGYSKKDDFLQFYVKDTGIGIPEDRIEAVFKRFVQADITNKMALQGAGLGLSISKAYVEMLGGQLWVESKVGVGSCFYFTIPYYRETTISKHTKATVQRVDEETITNKLKIIVAEDDKISQLLISITIKNFAREIIYAKNGKEAVQACINNPDIDLVLMDMQMPEMNGYEATQEIRKINKDVLIIAQTANALSNENKKILKAGCNDIIPKPIQVEALKRLIGKYFK